MYRAPDFNQPPPLTRVVFAMVLCLGGVDAFAEPQAVKESNYEAGFDAGDTYVSSDRDSHFYGFNGRATYPLTTYLGASLTGVYANTKTGDAFFSQTGTPVPTSPPPTCKLDSINLNADLFLRKTSLGRVGVRYGGGRVKSNCSATFVATGTDKLDTETVVGYAEYYFTDVTVAAARSQTDFDGATELDSSSLTAMWYPNNDLRLALSADGRDLKDTYRFDLEYQLPIFGNASSVLLGYTTQDRTVRTHSLMVGFRYYFGKRLDVIVRDRLYR
jgi:hypothetical protein